MDAGGRFGRRSGVPAKSSRRVVLLLAVVLGAVAALGGGAALFHGPTKSAVASWLAALCPAEAKAEAPAAAVAEPVVVAAPAAPKAQQVQESAPEPEPAVAVAEPVMAAAESQPEPVAADPEPVAQTHHQQQQQQQQQQQNASAASTAVPTQQQHLDAEKAEVVQRNPQATAVRTPHSFFGDVGAHANNKAGKPSAAAEEPAAAAAKAAAAAASAAAAAAAAAASATTATAAAPKAPVTPKKAEAAPASSTSTSSAGGKGKEAKEVKSRRKAKQQQQQAAAVAPRPRLVLRVGEALQPGQKMGNRCFDLGPEGFCAPATYLALDEKGRLELREGWDGPGMRKWQARRRVRLGKLVQAGLRKLKGGKQGSQAPASARASYRLRLTEAGMLELLAPDGDWAWRSGVEGARNGTAYEAFVSDDGKVVVYQGGSRVHWRSA